MSNSQMATAQQPNATVVPTIRTYSNIVVIDVVVTDSQGKPIFSNRPPAPVNGPVNVLLLDYLNTPLTAQPAARKQLLDYLDHAPAGTRIAIFGLTTQLSMLQGFTSDMSVLKAALTQKKGAPQGSQIMSDPVNGGAIGNSTLSNALDSPSAVPENITPEIVANINRFEAMQTSFELDMRFFTDWRERAAPSRFFDPADGWNAVWIGLTVHLFFAIPTPLLWIVVIVRAIRNFPHPPQPGAHSRSHIFWAWLATVEMGMTALTGWIFYWLAFVA